MIDTLLKWIIWPFWRPYQIDIRRFPNDEMYHHYVDFEEHYGWIPIAETRAKRNRVLLKECHAWAFKNLTWDGKLKEEKHEH